MLRFAILQLLNSNSLSGYEIKKKFDTSLAFCWHATHSQIYPELRRMQKDGLVIVRTEEQVGKPNRNIYTITELGKQSLLKWLKSPLEELKNKDELLLKVFSIHLMEPKDAYEMLDEAKALHGKLLSDYQKIRDSLQAKYFHNGKPTVPWIFGRYFDLKQSAMLEETYINWICWVEEQLENYSASIFEDNVRKQ